MATCSKNMAVEGIVDDERMVLDDDKDEPEEAVSQALHRSLQCYQYCCERIKKLWRLQFFNSSPERKSSAREV